MRGCSFVPLSGSAEQGNGNCSLPSKQTIERRELRVRAAGSAACGNERALAGAMDREWWLKHGAIYHHGWA